jgi:hypothetical protein
MARPEEPLTVKCRANNLFVEEGPGDDVFLHVSGNAGKHCMSKLFTETRQRTIGREEAHKVLASGGEPETEALRAHIDADHGVLVQLGRIADAAIKMLEHVNMDTEEDRALHTRAVGALRGRLDEITAKVKEANETAEEAGP